METKICEIVARNTALADLKKEDVLNLKLSVLSVPVAVQEIAKCYLHLKINGDIIPNLVMDSINYSKFDDLFHKATALHGIQGKSYLTGLKINFGIKDDAIFLVFQPVRLNRSDEPNRYNVSEGGYFCYADDVKGFVDAQPADMASLEAYQQNIQIRHLNELNFSNFDEERDSPAVIIPFQVIFSLIYYNEYNTDIFLFNGIVERKVNGVEQISHSIFASSARDEDGLPAIRMNTKRLNLVEDFTGRYANRSHLCPPCDYVEDLNISYYGPTKC